MLTLFPYTRLLLIEFVAATAVDRDATKAIERKDKRPLPIPVRISFFDIRRKYNVNLGIVLLLEIPTNKSMLLSLMPYICRSCSSSALLYVYTQGEQPAEYFSKYLFLVQWSVLQYVIFRPGNVESVHTQMDISH